ncbi:MAG: hypothetical protein U9R75_11980, partial [Candidatus Thermoplasmatota archaeon]|nr:hypothetical protein [Candidatus Thermoplasmatota archaeon]
MKKNSGEKNIRGLLPIVKDIIKKKIFVLLIMISLMSLSFDTIHSNSEDNMIASAISMDTPGRGISLSGEVDIYDGADSIIYGKTFDSVGHKLGTYSYIGDVNGDGINDIAITSAEDHSNQGIRGDGRIYIFFGDGSGIPEVIDLDEDEADLIVMGDAHYSGPIGRDTYGWTCIGNQMETGDYNNDGFQDMVVSVPGIWYTRNSIIIWGEKNGWPKEIVVNTSNNDLDYNWTLLDAGSHSKDLIPIYDGIPDTPRGAFGLDRDITSDFMETADIDGDGFDDLVSGGFLTCNSVRLP